jgi:hypothetical protein
MARYAGRGKNTVEGCRSDRRVGLPGPGPATASGWSINVETQRHYVLLKYRSRSCGEDWSDVEHCQAVRYCSRHRVAYQPPFRRRRKRERGVA